MSSKAAGRRGKQMRAQIINPQGGPSPLAGSKTGGKPASEHISGRRKSWLSLREKVDGRGNDMGDRVGLPWWKAPIYKDARMKRWAA